jgi:hypothetical protein
VYLVPAKKALTNRKELTIEAELALLQSNDAASLEP